jgi:parallel beta-helix repeat protein
MVALITVSPASPVIGSSVTATATGGGDHHNRLLLDSVEVYSGCSDDAFTAGVTVSSTVGVTQTLDWEQLILGVWTAADSVSFTTVAAPSSGSSHIVSTNSVTIEDELIVGSMPAVSTSVTGFGISTSGGTAASPLTNLTIRRCTIRGFRMGIYLRFVNTIVIEDCIIEDADYAGILLISCKHATIQRNTVRRIGYVKDPATGFQGNNAYGISTNRDETSSLVTDPVSEDVLIDSNTIDWVPLWQGINTHGGKDHTISNNTVSHCPRGIFLAGSPTPPGTTQCVNLTVDSNNIYTPVTKAGGTTDLEGILYASVATISITDNGIDYDAVDPVGGGTIGSPGYFDYGNASTGETISGNHVI